MLKEEFSVLEARNGEEGLEIALKEHPDLLLVDIQMPKMDGLTMLKKIREDEWGKKVKFIILTNVNEVTEISTAMKLAEDNDNESFEYCIKANIKIEDIVKKIKTKLGV